MNGYEKYLTFICGLMDMVVLCWKYVRAMCGWNGMKKVKLIFSLEICFWDVSGNGEAEAEADEYIFNSIYLSAVTPNSLPCLSLPSLILPYPILPSPNPHPITKL